MDQVEATALPAAVAEHLDTPVLARIDDATGADRETREELVVNSNQAARIRFVQRMAASISPAAQGTRRRC